MTVATSGKIQIPNTLIPILICLLDAASNDMLHQFFIAAQSLRNYRLELVAKQAVHVVSDIDKRLQSIPVALQIQPQSQL